MARILRRTFSLLLALMLLGGTALAESFAFTLRAETSPDWYASEHHDLFEGFASLLNAMELEGTYVSDNGRFDLNADVYLGSGRTRSRTGWHLYGLDSHWGVTSTLLGQEELMVNTAALLPFGMKARAYLDLPLDQAALLVPYTHTHAFRAPSEVLAPLFPVENGTTWIQRSAVNDLARAFLEVCDEDAAFSAWLEVTGTYDTAVQIANYIINMPQMVYGFEVIRTDSTLTWDALGLVTIMTLEKSGNKYTLAFRIPNVARVDGVLRATEDAISGSVTANLYGLDANLTFELPASVPVTLPRFFVDVSIQSPVFPSGAFSLLLEGTAQGDHITVELLKNAGRPLLAIEAELTPLAPESLPAWHPEDLTGMNILSATGDSLGVLLRNAQEPLLTGVFDLLVAAPPEAVQSLMDALEDLGVIDLFVDSLLGEPGY